MLKGGRVNILIDTAWGSCGKGNIAEYIARTEQIDVCCYVGGPNSGHQFHLNNEVHTVKMLPVSGIINEDSVIIISAGTIINLSRLLEEIEKYNVGNRILIAPTAPIINEYCIEYEKDNLQYIASTFQGTGAALGLKTMRSDKIELAKDIPSLKQWVNQGVTDNIVRSVNLGGTVLAETSQGVGLSIDSEFYPFCTSRNVNVGQTMSYLDIPHTMVGNVIGLARTYPIRVGNVPTGYSGDVYKDSHEITWEELSEHINRPVKELTTVTKRVRRVFTFSKIGFERAVLRNGVNVCFLTFADYLNESELDEMVNYLTSCKFAFNEIYLVKGFGDFENNIERVR